MFRWVYILVFFLFGLSPVWSQVWVPSGTETRRPSAIQFDAGITRFQDDYYGYLSPNFTFNHGNNFGYSFSLPVHVLGIDRDPKIPEAKAGQIRQFDYNSRNDYARALNYISYGTYNQQVPGSVAVSLYAGKVIDGYVGHGTIVNKYQSSSRMDAYNPAVLADMNTDYGGVQYFSNSVVNFEVNAARVYIKPLAIGRQIYSWIYNEPDNLVLLSSRGNVLDESGRLSVEEEAGTESKLQKQKKEEQKSKERPRPYAKDSRMELVGNDPWYNRLTIGYTQAWDRAAPNELRFNTNGSPVLEKNQDNPTTKDISRVQIEGFDIEHRLLNLPFVELTPYIDFNRIRSFNNAQGAHYGAILRLGSKDLNVILKPEVREFTANYSPMYFDSFYEIERFQKSPISAPLRTKYDFYENQNNRVIRGYYHTIYLNIYHLGFELAVEDYDLKGNKRVFAGAYIPLGSSFIFSVFYTKKGYESMNKAFDPDNNAQGAIEIAKSFGPVGIRIQNYRRYFLDTSEKSFISSDEIRILVSGGFSF